jgi:peptide chain release factor 3
MRVCSGRFDRRHEGKHVRTGKEMKLANALTFMASDREIADEAYRRAT